MSKEAVTEFLHDVTRVRRLREELADFAAHHGYRVTADELVDVDFEHLPVPVSDPETTEPEPGAAGDAGERAVQG
jgi:hypothetical protein